MFIGNDLLGSTSTFEIWAHHFYFLKMHEGLFLDQNKNKSSTFLIFSKIGINKQNLNKI